MAGQLQSESKVPIGKAFTPVPTGGLLQRKCACGSHSMAGGECEECAKKKSLLQRKLMIGASNDPLEQEADRVADQVMFMPLNSAINNIPPRIQRFSGQASEGVGNAPPSVDRVLASSGRPLEPSLRQDMEARFGHDFSRVRVHTDTAAEQSARDVDARAYTVARDIVFGAGWFVPETYEGKRLIAHELAHVVQQSNSDGIHVSQGHSETDLSASPQVLTYDRNVYLARAPESNIPSSVDTQDRTKIVQRILRPELSLDEVMSIIESIRPSGSASGLYELVRGGQVLVITKSEYDNIRASVKKILLDSLRKVRRKAEDAQLQYDAQHKIDEDQWFISGAVRLFGGIEDPGESIRQNVRFAIANANAAQFFIEREQFVRGAEFFANSTRFATSAKKASQAYVDNIISTAETTVTVLEVTAVASATVLVVSGIIAAPAIASAARAAPLALALSTGAVPAAEVGVATAPAVVAAAAPAAGAVAAPAVVAAAAPAAGAVAAPAVVAAAAPAAVTVSSSLSTAALATAGIAVASTTLTSDSPKSDEKKSCPYPTGLTLSDPIPIAWHKIPQLYPSPIQLDGIDYFRDNPTILPRGGRIGVPARFWPRLGKIVQLVSERRGKAASNFRAVLESYGFNWENRRFLQADHAQDLQWASPKNGENLDTFSNLWPYDGAANMSAGPTQNQFQRVSFCESRNGPPMVNVPIQSIKRPGGWGRYFVIRSVGMP